jgi:hypothetical protein
MDEAMDKLAIIVPSIVAIFSLLFQYLINITNTNNERLKIFYNDRVVAFKEINQSISRLEQSIEATLNFKSIMAGKLEFSDIVKNKGNALPPELFSVFQNNLYGSTIVGRDNFLKCIEDNKLFLNNEIEIVITKLKKEYISVIPEPLLPESIDQFLENKLPVVNRISREMVIECRRTLMIEK